MQDISLNNILIDINNYVIRKRIYQGSFGDVFKGLEKTEKKKVAIKFYDISGSSDISNSFRELNTIRLLNLPGTVKILGFRFPLQDYKKVEKFDDVELNGAVLISEYANNGSISNLIREYLQNKGQPKENSKIFTKLNDKITPTVRSKIIFGVASTMKNLHEYNIIHRNLKLEKVLLDDNLEPLISFSFLSKILLDDEPLEMGANSALNTPPEMLQEDPRYDLSADVYAFSFFLYLMFSDDIKFENIELSTEMEFMNIIRDGGRPIRPDNISDAYWELIQLCWKQNPEERPTFDQITEMLKDDKYAINEFGKETDLNQLHEYWLQIEKQFNENDFEDDDPKIKRYIRQIIKKSKSISNQAENQIELPVIYNKPDFHSRKKYKILNTKSLKKFKHLKKIGHGINSEVIEVTRSQKYALKVFNSELFNQQEKNEEEEEEEDINKNADSSNVKYDLEALKSFQADLETLDNLDHPNIAKSFGFSYGDETYSPAYLLELYPSNLKKSIKSLTDVERVSIIYEIAETMSSVHQVGIIHRDLKPENILLDEENHAKLSDFGVTKLSSSETCQFDSSYHFIAPELFRSTTDYDLKVDVYSFGIIVYYILTHGECPKMSVAEIVLGKKIEVPKTINQFSRELIEYCTNIPSKRPPFSQIADDIKQSQFRLINGIENNLSEIYAHLELKDV